MVTSYQFPKDHWRHLRTTNVVDSPFAAVRGRPAACKRYKRVDSRGRPSGTWTRRSCSRPYMPVFGLSTA